MAKVIVQVLFVVANRATVKDTILRTNHVGRAIILVEVKAQTAGATRNNAITLHFCRFITTIEPKHGTTVALYLETASLSWQRWVLDESLKDGHALATADFLGTGGDQIVAGWRGMATRGVPGVKLYVPENIHYTKWKTYPLSGKETAVEDIKAGDLNDDGKPEIIVACRQTHNLRILWNETKK